MLKIAALAPSSHGGGRPRHEDQVDRDGPPFLAAMVGTDDGRWRHEFSQGNKAASEAQARLARSLGLSTDILMRSGQGAGVVGLVVFQG